MHIGIVNGYQLLCNAHAVSEQHRQGDHQMFSPPEMPEFSAVPTGNSKIRVSLPGIESLPGIRPRIRPGLQFLSFVAGLA